MPLLADRFTVVAPDLPGVGGSSGPAGGASAPTEAFEKASLARDFHAFVATLGARRVVLAGHDVGGLVAYAYARLYPRELAGVAVLDVPLPGVAPWDAIRASGHAWHFQFHDQQPLAETLVAGRQAPYFRYFINSNAANPSAIPDADVATFARAYGSPASLHAGFGFYRAFAADGRFNGAHAEPLDVPLLLAGADRSMGSGEAELERGLRALGVRDIRVAVIPNSGHWIAEENPTATAAIMDTARAQVLAYPTAAFRRDEATHVSAVEAGGGSNESSFEVTLASGDRVRARRLVLATGIVDELADLPGLQELWGTTVAHCSYCHAYEVRDRRLGVLAVGALSVHTALLLPDWSADVTLFTNGAVALTDEQRAALAARGVRVDARPVEALVGDAPALAGLRVAGGEVVGVDALFTLPLRTRPASPLAEQLGCAADDGPFGPVLCVDARKATTVPGVYAAGDAANVAWSATSAAADGVLAGAMAHQSLALAPPAV